MNVFDKIYKAVSYGVTIKIDDSLIFESTKCKPTNLVRRNPHFVMLGKKDYYQLMTDNNARNNMRTHPDGITEILGVEIILVLKDIHYSVGWNDIK